MSNAEYQRSSEIAYGSSTARYFAGGASTALRVRAALATASSAASAGSTSPTRQEVRVAYPDAPSTAARASQFASVVRCAARRPVVEAIASSTTPLVKKP